MVCEIEPRHGEWIGMPRWRKSLALEELIAASLVNEGEERRMSFDGELQISSEFDRMDTARNSCRHADEVFSALSYAVT